MQKPNLNKIIADNLDKAKFQSKKQPSLPSDGWLNEYSNGGIYLSDRAKATQFGQYERGGGYFPEYHSFAPPRMSKGGPGDGFLGLFKGKGRRGSVACPTGVCRDTSGSGGGLGIGRFLGDVGHEIGEGVKSVGHFLGDVGHDIGDLLGGIGDGHRRKRKCEQLGMDWDPVNKTCKPRKSTTSDYGDEEEDYIDYSHGTPSGGYMPSYTPPPQVYVPPVPKQPSYGMIGPSIPMDIVYNYSSPEGNTPQNLMQRGQLYNGMPTGINSDMTGMAKYGGDISIPDLQEGRWLTQYADEGLQVTTETTKPPTKQESAMAYISNFAKNNPNKFGPSKQAVIKKTTPYKKVEATKANIIRGLLPVPKNAAQMISKNIFGDARMNEESLSDQEKLILWNTIQNAQKRSGVTDAGGTEYQDYGNQGYGTPEEYNQWFNKGNTTAFGTIKNSLTNPGYKLASTIGRGRYWQDPNDANTMYYTDVYDWNPSEKNYKGNNAYQLLRNYVRGTEDKDLNEDKNENYRMNFKLTKADIERIKAGKPALSTHPEVNFHTPTFKKGGWLSKYAPGGVTGDPTQPYHAITNPEGYHPKISDILNVAQKRQQETSDTRPQIKQGHKELPHEKRAREQKLREEAQQNSELAQTMGLFTPSGSNTAAGAIGASDFVNMNPLLTGPIMSTSRLYGAGRSMMDPNTYNPYFGSDKGVAGNIMGGLQLAGDVGMLRTATRTPQGNFNAEPNPNTRIQYSDFTDRNARVKESFFNNQKQKAGIPTTAEQYRKLLQQQKLQQQAGDILRRTGAEDPTQGGGYQAPTNKLTWKDPQTGDIRYQLEAEDYGNFKTPELYKEAQKDMSQAKRDYWQRLIDQRNANVGQAKQLGIFGKQTPYDSKMFSNKNLIGGKKFPGFDIPDYFENLGADMPMYFRDPYGGVHNVSGIEHPNQMLPYKGLKVTEGLNPNKFGGEQWLQKYPGGGLFGLPNIISLLPSSPIMKWANHTPTTKDLVASVADPTGFSNVPFVTEAGRKMVQEPSWGNAANLGWNLLGSIPFGIGSEIRNVRNAPKIIKAVPKIVKVEKEASAARKAGQTVSKVVSPITKPIGKALHTGNQIITYPARVVDNSWKARGITPILNKTILDANKIQRGERAYKAAGIGAVDVLDYLFPGTPSQQNTQVPYAPEQKYGGTWLNKYK